MHHRAHTAAGKSCDAAGKSCDRSCDTHMISYVVLQGGGAIYPVSIRASQLLPEQHTAASKYGRVRPNIDTGANHPEKGGNTAETVFSAPDTATLTKQRTESAAHGACNLILGPGRWLNSDRVENSVFMELLNVDTLESVLIKEVGVGA